MTALAYRTPAQAVARLFQKVRREEPKPKTKREREECNARIRECCEAMQECQCRGMFWTGVEL